MDVIFRGCSKAFDKVPHNQLISKSSAIRLPPNIIRWVQRYSSSHRQFEDIGRTLSDVLGAKSGLSQGSILSPLLFLLHVNDLPDFVGLQVLI